MPSSEGGMFFVPYGVGRAVSMDCLSLSVVIITLNEEANLARTLASVAWADEIVVLDSGSTDRTREVAESFRAKFFVEPWKGFAAQKNSALEKATGDWILSLDADEEVEPALAEEIRAVLGANPSVAGFRIPRKNFFLGRWIKHGGFYPDPKLRLFRRGAGQFEDRLVHEDMRLDGATAYAEAQSAAPCLSHARQLHRAHEPLLVAGRARWLSPSGREASAFSISSCGPSSRFSTTTSCASASSTAARACCCTFTTRRM